MTKRLYQIRHQMLLDDFRNETLRRLDVEYVRHALDVACGSRGFVSFSARRIGSLNTIVIHCYAVTDATLRTGVIA